MPRKSRATGVGRGHGPGSAATQFKDGMPSRNPLGRPKKVKLPPARSLEEAIDRVLRRTVQMDDGSTKKTVSHLEAMIEVLLNSFPRATPSEKIRILQYCQELAPDVKLDRPPEICRESIQEFVRQLGAFAEQERPDYKFPG